MKITEKTYIKISDFNGKKAYSTSISRTTEDNQKEYMYISVQFKKGTEPDVDGLIEIENAFMSWYKDRNGLCKPKIVVMEYKTVNKEETTSDSLPF